MHKLFIAIAVAVLAAGPVVAFDDNKDVMAAVH